MSQLLGRDEVVAGVAAAIERVLRSGGGLVVVSGPAGVGVTAVVEEALRPLGSKASRASAAAPAVDGTLWWIDDAQRMTPDTAVRLREAASDRAIVISGRRPLGSAIAGLVRAAARADAGAVLDVEPLAPAIASESVGLSDVDLARACGARLRLLAAATRARAGDLASTALHVAVEDLLADLRSEARRVFEVVAVGGESARLAAVEVVSQAGAEFDAALRELTEAGLVRIEDARLVPMVPTAALVTSAALGASRSAEMHAAYAEALDDLPGVDPREIADHVRLATDRLSQELAMRVLRASAERRGTAFDHDGALADLEVAAELAEVAAEGGAHDDRVRAFETLHALAVAQYFAGPVSRVDDVLRRAERFGDVASESQRDEIELYHAYLRADSGHPVEIPIRAGADEGPDHRAALTVRQLFLVDRVDDIDGLRAVCRRLIALDGDAATPIGRGAAALGRSVRASLAGSFELAVTEAEQGLAAAGDGSPEVVGGLVRELIWLCTLRGDLDAARRHAALEVEGRAPRIVEPSTVAHRASIEVLRGDLVRAAHLAERSLAMTRAAPVPRGLVRCGAWVALIGAMRGDITRARSLVAEAGRMFPLEANTLLATIVQLPRVQLALREHGAMPLPFHFRMERTEGPARLLLPTLAARLAIQRDDDRVIEAALDELDATPMSPPAAALAQRVRALRQIPSRAHGDVVDALDDSAAVLERLGFVTLAAETRLEWAELAAERGDASARGRVPDLVRYFDAQGLDDWGDRARRLARRVGMRIGGRRGGSGELTRRESEVVDLVVAGLSNAEIAGRLYLSERTVETHLQHVYRRLGVESRQAMISQLSAVGHPPGSVGPEPDSVS